MDEYERMNGHCQENGNHVSLDCKYTESATKLTRCLKSQEFSEKVTKTILDARIGKKFYTFDGTKIEDFQDNQRERCGSRLIRRRRHQFQGR